MDAKLFLEALRKQLVGHEHFRQDEHKLNEGAVRPWATEYREGYTVQHQGRFFAIKWALEKNGKDQQHGATVLILPLQNKGQISEGSQTATLRNGNEEDGVFFIKAGSGKHERIAALERDYGGAIGFPRYENGQSWIGPIEDPQFLGNLLSVASTSDVKEKHQKHLNSTNKANPLHMPPLNTILFGPPGTGKTYTLRSRYMERFTDREVILTPEDRASSLVKDLAWWEVIALALLDSENHQSSVSQILKHPLVEARRRRAANNNLRQMIWSSLQTHAKSDCPNVRYKLRIDPLLFWKDENAIWSIDTALAKSERPELESLLQDFRNPTDQVASITTRYRFTTFHQSFSYEDFVEGIKPQMEEREDGQIAYEIKDGVFKEICKEAAANPSKPYALFIDEINRGNVASIFGELITLIEEDKRLNAPNELKAVLPYSREEFGVPPNLYIVGTMNTADRSVEALDTALRRRFVFEDVRPDPEFIVNPEGLGVDVRRLFTVINSRIEQLLDHDHCIGHYYFMGIETVQDLRRVFANKILPLLREYFYGNPAKIGLILGQRFVSRKTDTTAFASGDWGVDELDKKAVYQFTDVSELEPEDFASIYA